MIKNAKEAPEGTYRVLIRVEDILNEDAPDYLDLSLYKLYSIYVKEKNNYLTDGWARTWGGTEYDAGMAVASDGFGNIYVGGRFADEVDFHPGIDDVVIRTSNGESDCFLARYDSSGKFKWVQTWGGTGYDAVNGIDVSNDGQIFVVGYFNNTVDFDPGSGTFTATASGGRDAFISKFDITGNWHWTKILGGSGIEEAKAVAYLRSIDQPMNRLYACGSFSEQIIYDDGGPVGLSNGSEDVFLVKINPVTGTFIWGKNWGGNNLDQANDINVTWSEIQGMDRVYVCGLFYNNSGGTGIDFDPCPGELIRQSAGMADAFTSKFNGTTGNHILTYTWGSENGDAATALNAHHINGWFVGGYIGGQINLNPTGGFDISQHYGGADAFIVGLNSSNDEYMWGTVFGGSGSDSIGGISGGVWGHPYIVGSFEGTVDFNPGIEINEFTSNGGSDCFLLWLQTDMQFIWARTWGGSMSDCTFAVTRDSNYDVYTSGLFYETVDFSPETYTDYHTSGGKADAFLLKYNMNGQWD
ncbi:MAG TPA: hypothetical protein ENN67_07985 [Firmicutes bacterium]|nr:hypothetical protein [Bacillota bacterium]